MSVPDFDSALDTAIQVSRAAGRLLMERFGQVHRVRHKGVVDLVTEADEMSERLIIQSLRDRFPDHAVLAEESGAAGASPGGNGPRWLIDPLDGTTNFAHGYPIFCVSLALELDGVVQLGVVYVPMLDDLFVAARGRGASVNGAPLRVSETPDLIHALVATGFNYDLEARRGNLEHWASFVQVTQGARRSGAAAFDLCCVAAGRLDGFWEAGLKPWDAAAGTLAVTEAGGTVTGFEGEPFRIDGPDCLASNGRIHEHMRTVIEHGPQHFPGGMP
ncbi:MAG TPA: inositol monophosphatase family protein [Thermomicrobiaceae bacterium]|nr:inositol monophosphatase family protein [Thermomicrobiaceae bacterium]